MDKSMPMGTIPESPDQQKEEDGFNLPPIVGVSQPKSVKTQNLPLFTLRPASQVMDLNLNKQNVQPPPSSRSDASQSSESPERRKESSSQVQDPQIPQRRGTSGLDPPAPDTVFNLQPMVKNQSLNPQIQLIQKQHQNSDNSSFRESDFTSKNSPEKREIELVGAAHNI